MTDWIEHDGGPQPVADDVWVQRDNRYRNGEDISEAQYADWEDAFHFRILNQHLIDAARLEGIRLGLEAKMRLEPSSHPALRPRLRMPDPATIAREAVLDKLASEAQEQGMGYEKEADQ